MVEPIWNNRVILCKQKVEKLASSANMGQLLQDKFDDDEGGGPNTLLQRIGWVVCSDGHPIWKDRGPIGAIQPLETAVSLWMQYIPEAYIEHTPAWGTPGTLECALLQLGFWHSTEFWNAPFAGCSTTIIANDKEIGVIAL